MEDLNECRADVAAKLCSIVETGRVEVSGQPTPVVVHEAFRVFATMRTGSVRRGSASTDVYLNKFYARVRLDAFTKQELMRVCETRVGLYTHNSAVVHIVSAGGRRRQTGRRVRRHFRTEPAVAIVEWTGDWNSVCDLVVKLTGHLLQ